MTEFDTEKIICMYVTEYLSWQKFLYETHCKKHAFTIIAVTVPFLCHMLATCNFLYKDT